jgi:hypothetical protein
MQWMKHMNNWNLKQLAQWNIEAWKAYYRHRPSGFEPPLRFYHAVLWTESLEWDAFLFLLSQQRLQTLAFYLHSSERKKKGGEGQKVKRKRNTEHGGKRTREGAKSGIGRLERMKHGDGIKGRDDRSSGIEILMSDTFTKINKPIVTGPCDC